MKIILEGCLLQVGALPNQLNISPAGPNLVQQGRLRRADVLTMLIRGGLQAGCWLIGLQGRSQKNSETLAQQNQDKRPQGQEKPRKIDPSELWFDGCALLTSASQLQAAPTTQNLCVGRGEPQAQQKLTAVNSDPL